MTQSGPLLRRRYLLQLMAGATGAVVLHACNTSSQNSESATSMSMGSAPWVGQLPLYIAQEKGFFAEEGLDFELLLFGASGDYISAFASGNIDSLAPVSAEAILLNTQGKDFKIVLIQDNSVGGDGILARDTITSIKDFKGKDVAVDTTGVSYFFLLQVLKEAGLTKDDINIVNVDPAGAAAAFESGNVDIAVSYAPYLPETARAVEDGRIIYDSSQMPTAIIDLYLVDTTFIEENPAAVQAFVNGIFKGTEFMTTNRAEALEIGAKELELSIEALEGDLKGVKIPSLEDNLAMIAEPDSDTYILKPLEDLTAFLVEEGQIESAPDDIESLLDPQFVLAYQQAQNESS